MQSCLPDQSVMRLGLEMRLSDACCTCCRDDVARRADDAVHRTANQANRGVDKVRETRRDFHQSAPSAGQVQDKGEEALESSKDAAVQAKCDSC